MRCGNCGLEMISGAAFCPSCGRPAGQSWVGTESASRTSAVTSSGLQPNVAGSLCYLVGFITGIFFLVAEPYKRDPFVRFHAYQSIFVSVAAIVVRIGFGVLLSIMPWSLWSLISMVSALVLLAFFLLFLLLMFKAYSNERFKLPVIGDLAERQAQGQA